ncbi:45324_t:CDS:1, partial [Gigaspora margarita]
HVEIKKTAPSSRNKKYKRKVYQYEKMDEKSWVAFTETVSNAFQKAKTKKELQTIQDLNKK